MNARPSTREMENVSAGGRFGVVLLLLALGCAFGPRVASRGAAAEIHTALRLAGEGVAALDANETSTALARLQAAAELRPDVPRILAHLAAAQVAAGQTDAALGTLRQIAGLGLFLPVEKAEEYTPLRAHPELAAVAKLFAANDRPRGRGETAFVLQGVTGLIEGIAWRGGTGEFLFGDVHHRAIWARGKSGVLRRLTPEDDALLGVFALLVDESAGCVWAATAHVPQMRGAADGERTGAALVEVDLANGAVRRTIPVPPTEPGARPRLLGDLTRGEDGAILATDSTGRTVWRLAPGAEALEAVSASEEFLSPQGIAVVADGGVAVVADRENGLLRLDLATGSVSRLAAPAGTTLLGLDGLVRIGETRLVATQPGVRPARVLRIDLDASASEVVDVTVLEAAHLTLAAPALACLGPGGDVHVVANGGWARFEETDPKPTAPRGVAIYRIAATQLK